MQHWLTGLITSAGRTRAIGEATTIGLGVAALSLVIGIAFVEAAGIRVYLACALLGYTVQTSWLVFRSRAVRRSHLAAAAAALLAMALSPSGVRAARLPDGFALEPVVGGPFNDAPIAFAFLPDGRTLLVERASGVVRCAAAGDAASDSVFTVPGVEAGAPERGLLGIAVRSRVPSARR